MAWFRRKKRNRPADGSMTLMEHLHELRRRLGWALAFIVVGMILGIIWFGNGIPAIGLKSLGDLLNGPYCAAKEGVDCQFLATEPFSALKLVLQAGLMAGLVFSSPGWLYEIWAFVTPALYSKERKYALTFVGSAVVLFVAGAVLAYLVIPTGLKVLFGVASETVKVNLNPQSYYSFLMTLLIVFGLSFELPLFLVALNIIGVLKGRQLAKWRRYAIFAMTVFAAIVVPGNDPITMLALAVALVILYEFSVQFAKINDKRRGRHTEDYTALADDEASPI